MNEIEVLSTNNIVEISTNSINQTEVLLNVANKFRDLIDVNPSGISSTNDNYLVAYDADTDKFTLIDPDTALVSAASTVTFAPGFSGLPEPFLARLDLDLDDRIDIDAGTF